MSQRFYLQPSALLYGAEAAAAVAAGQAGWLAGGPVAFTHIRLLSGTGEGGCADVRAYADLKASRDGTLGPMLDRIECVRPAVEGLSGDDVTVMGVVNVTPDSFSDGGEFADPESAIAQGGALIEAGADILDIGGESTRPGSDAMSAADELARVLPVITALNGGGIPISIDTRKSEVMRSAVAAGASMLNDISALQFDPLAVATARELDLPVVLMHSRGDPKTMQDDPQYTDVVLDVYDALAERIEACEAAGIQRRHLIVDPGIGFGKTFDHNRALMRGLAAFHGLGVRIMLGVSRKGFLGALSGEKVAGKRVIGSVAAALMGVMQGVQIVRVHDVKETVQAIRTWHGIWHSS